MGSYETRCPCGEGTVTMDDPNWGGAGVGPIRINCSKCRETHEIKSHAKGIDPRKGHSYDAYNLLVAK